MSIGNHSASTYINDTTSNVVECIPENETVNHADLPQMYFYLGLNIRNVMN